VRLQRLLITLNCRPDGDQINDPAARARMAEMIRQRQAAPASRAVNAAEALRATKAAGESREAKAIDHSVKH
jgi:hypothetical protein